MLDNETYDLMKIIDDSVSTFSNGLVIDQDLTGACSALDLLSRAPA